MTPPPTLKQPSELKLARFAHFPGLRVLAWSGDHLFAGRGYRLLHADVANTNPALTWRPVGTFRTEWRRRLSVMNGLTARLFRDGFHALAVLPDGGLVAAVPGAIVSLCPGESEFDQTFRITRGTRPLHITSVPGGAVYWGEYFDNPLREEVHIYASSDSGASWTVAYTFSKGSIRHVHNIVHDPWGNCLWVLTGDYGDECRILRATCDFRQVDAVLQGNQQARAVALVPTEDGLYFSSDTPLEANHIYRLDRKGALSQLAPISSSSIHGCRVGNRVYFSTMVEPSEVNEDRNVRIFGGNVSEGWQSLVSWRKDLWPMGLFQYGNAFLPDGENSTNILAVTTMAVRPDDMTTSLYTCV